MKGFIYTEFFEMVEQKFDYEMVDRLIETTCLPSSRGISTSVSTYSHTEMAHLLANLSRQTTIPIQDLLKTFSGYLFKTLTKTYHHFKENSPDSFSFLYSIHDYIHAEVKKLYPDAELPHFDIMQLDANTLVMHYSSARKMSDLAYDLIEECLDYYDEKALITKVELKENGSLVKFIIVKQ